MTQTPPTTDAVSILIDAADAITERGRQRDQPSGERSMGRTVRAFNAMFGASLTEQQGWQFMALLKMARGTGGDFRADDYTDQAGYAALAGECAAHAQHMEMRSVVNADEADAAIARLDQLIRHRRRSTDKP